MPINFAAIINNGSNFVSNVLENKLEPWSEVFEFEYDKETLEPVNKGSKLSEPAEGVYRPESTIKAIQPKANPYRGMDNKGLFQFYFEGPILNSCIKAQIHQEIKLQSGDILLYPTYIYSLFKIATNPQADEVFMRAINELDKLITMGDMNFTEANNYRGNSYKYDCPFFLSFLKTQVVILLVNDTSIRLWRNKEGVKPVGNFGVYDPYHKVASWTHPAIYLDVEAMRTHAQKEQKNPVELYQRVMLTLLAYAYQDPTNEIDNSGTFTKLSMQRHDRIDIYYDEQAADEFVNSYLNISHN